MSRSVEQRLANAAAAGELRSERLEGKPLADIDRVRSDGWWAERTARTEVSRERRRAAEEARSAARVRFWRTATRAELDALVAEANAAIDHANLNMVDDDQLERFDPLDIAQRWNALRRG